MAQSNNNTQVEFDAVIVGAGFAGLYMLLRLRRMGLRVRVIEAGSDVGGTWFWNRYPGARCDVESLEYSYQFDEDLQQEWEWTERYATQPEILRYLNHVADRFELRGSISFHTRVSAATYQEEGDYWTLATEAGETITARFYVMATGCLSAPNEPNFPGLDSFEGNYYLTSKWPHDGVDFAGLKVGVVGTGSSAIQTIPLVAQQAEHLYVFQRRPAYTVPARNQVLDPEKVKQIKTNYRQFRQENREMAFGVRVPPGGKSAVEVDDRRRKKIFEAAWQIGGLPFSAAFDDIMENVDSNHSAGEFIRSKIRKIVDDPKLAKLLSPDSIVFCRRLCVDTDYYASFNRDNVDLVDISNAPIERITNKGLVTGEKEYELDAIIFAIGFDAMTGALLRIDIRGREGRTLKEKWAEGPKTYLGLAVEGFPNLFTITGPGSPSVLSNMVPSIEQHVEWIADCIGYLRENNLSAIEASSEAEDAWVKHVNEVAETTLFPACGSWYTGANVPGKPQVFMPYIGFPTYVKKCNEVAENGYKGFELK
jgi:cation diffusion facilitator CzcD-associated flavoprotein CzcO